MRAPIVLNGSFLREPATGSGQYTLHLIRELGDLLELPPRVVVPFDRAARPAAEMEIRDRLGGARAEVIPVRLPPLPANPAKVWFEQAAYPAAARAAIARSGNPGLLHVPYFGSPLCAPAPVVVTIHDLIMMALPIHRGSALVRLYTWLAGRAARRARLVLTDSEWSRGDIVRFLGIPPERVRVIPLAPDDRQQPDPGPEAIARVRRDYNLDRPYVFYLGGLDWRKNVPGLIEAFARVSTDRLLAIGGAIPPAGNPLFPDVRTIAARSPAADRIRLIGRVAEADKPALYAGADVFVFPSRYEGFGLTVLEAMARGAPVVTTRATSLPEVAGDAALLVDPDDPAGLAEAIGRVLDDPGLRRRLRAAGPRRAAQFSWRRTAEATLAAYCEVLFGG